MKPDKETARAFRESARIIVESQKRKYGNGWEYMHEDIKRAVCVEQIVPTVISRGSMPTSGAGNVKEFTESIRSLWSAVLDEIA